MDELKKLIIPEKPELAFLVSVSTALLFFENFKRYKTYWSGDAYTVSANAKGLDTYISNWLLGVEGKIDPRFVDFVAWLFIGAISFAVISVLVAMYHSANQEVELLHYYRNPKGKRHEFVIFMSKTALRLVGLVGLLFWTIVFFRLINPTLVVQFFSATVHLTDPISYLWIVLIIITFALSIYTFSILARLAALKVRVFS